MSTKQLVHKLLEKLFPHRHEENEIEKTPAEKLVDQLVVGQDVCMVDAICIAKGKIIEITSSCVQVQVYSYLSSSLTNKILPFNRQGEYHNSRNEGGITYLYPTDDEKLIAGYEQAMPERRRRHGV